MESLDSGSTRIYHQHIPLRVTYDLKDMGMASYEYVRPVFVDEPACPRVISSGISADMGHKHFHPFAFEEAVERMGEAEIVVVAVSRHAFERLEGGDGGSQVKPSPKISRVPYFIHRLEEFPERLVEDPVRIGYETYIHDYKLITIFFL